MENINSFTRNVDVLEQNMGVWAKRLGVKEAPSLCKAEAYVWSDLVQIHSRTLAERSKGFYIAARVRLDEEGEVYVRDRGKVALAAAVGLSHLYRGGKEPRGAILAHLYQWQYYYQLSETHLRDILSEANKLMEIAVEARRSTAA